MIKILTVTLGLAALITPASANLIANGNFATDLTGWATGGGGCGGSPAWSSTGNPGGSVLLNGCGESGQDPFASQSLSGLGIGTTYNVSWDMLLHVNVGGGSGKSFGVFLDTEPNSPIAFAEFLDGIWHTVQTSFVATSTTHTLIFAAELGTTVPGGPTGQTDVSYFLDNVIVDAAATTGGVPEPSAILLAGAGLGALFLRRRLRS